MNKIIKQEVGLMDTEWYPALIEECEAIITESGEASRWALIDGYHQLGSRILEDRARFEKEGIDQEGFVKRISQSLGKNPRTIYKAIQLATEYRKPDELPGGKNITWSKVCNRVLLGKSVDTDDCSHDNVVTWRVCSDCHKHLK
jgi:hypothetical protein